MSPNTCKYFHYFIACIFLDLIIIYGLGYYFHLQHIHFLVLLWVISNVLNYPRIDSRRFISYYQLLSLTIKQLATFLAFWALALILFSPFKLAQELYAPLLFLSTLFSRLLFVFILRLYRIVGRGYNRFYMIGNSPVMNNIKNNFLSVKSHGYIFEGQTDTIDLESLRKLIIEKHLNEIYCSSKSVNQNDLSNLLGFALHYGVNVHVVSDLSIEKENEAALFYSELDIEDFPLIDRKNLIIKRLFDILFSTFIIIGVLWWLTIILGILIKLESKGPIFFKQPRAGRAGKYFMCLKFRSMKVTSIEKQATKNDVRITKIGRLIRKLSIDELPQFINVFLGQMSVVGPRPHIKLLNDKYGSAINNYDSRMLVKPGITGLSQISGLRGETAENTSMANRVKVDMIYIKSWSIGKDMIIVLKTIYDLLFLRHKEAF